MTALATLYLRDAILMSADSLLVKVDNYESKNVLGRELIQKLFLVKRTGTGISAIGYSGWGGKSVGQILREFANGAGAESQVGIAQSLSEFLTQNYLGLRTSFHVCGYDGPEPFVFEVEDQNGLGWKVTRKNVGGDGTPIYNILAMCEPATVQYVLSNPPQYGTLSVPDAIAFLANFYRFEYEAVKLKKHPDVGGPIDLLILSPQRQWFPAVKSLAHAVLD